MSSDASTASVWEKLCQFSRDTALLTSVDALLQWDERTLMPPAGGDYRADQIALLARLIHQRRTNPQVGQWLQQLEADRGPDPQPHSDRETTVRWLRRDYDRQAKLPEKLVEELSRASIQGQQIWVEARRARDFSRFQKILTRIVELKRQEADALGFEEDRYDALLDEYEPYARTCDVAKTLEGLRLELVPLVEQIVGSSRKAPWESLRGSYPVAAQEKFGRTMAAAIGFQFQRGRLDVTSHPFCSGMGPNDCRITTRYDESFFPSAFYGILHEAGHGIYEQGLRPEMYGLPPGQYVSLGIHESQSRLWENQVGRSRAFWRFAHSHAQEHFGHQLPDDLDRVFFAMNHVQPSLIRVEADEVTYNLHIIIRFELERELISDQLQVADLPEAWNHKYQHYLGITPPHDGEGVLQDIHWSAGLFGYFPTYSLGNLIAAQLFQQAESELGELTERFARGDFQPLHAWLTEHIYRHGQCYMPSELVGRATGRPLDHTALISYLRDKLTPLYGL